MKKIITLSLLILTVATSFAELAPTKNFIWADTNRNGMVTKAEFIAQRALWAKQKGLTHNEVQTEQVFLNKDKNKDGELTPKEYRQR